MPGIIQIVHRTEYRYAEPVFLNRHRLMLRPRDGHDLWVDDAFLWITPRAQLTWFFDAFGNSVADAVFVEPSDRLVIESKLLLRRYVRDYSGRNTDVHSSAYPCSYSAEDAIDLYPYLGLQHREEEGEIRAWLASVLSAPPPTAFAFLEMLSHAINDNLAYSRRDAMGTQTAAETIRRQKGTCRDFAFLFMEAARLSGFAARFVTGYLHSRPAGEGAIVGSGATHAWADAFIPGAGWIEFDPTNRIVGGRSLIRVGTTRTPAQASPISGSYRGRQSAFLNLAVSVDITETALGDPTTV